MGVARLALAYPHEAPPREARPTPAWRVLGLGLPPLPRVYLLAGSDFQNATPLACWPTSAVPTFAIALRSNTSSFPGAPPTPSLLTKAYFESAEMATACASVVLVGSF